jgi:chromatin segregation and condensation protein Rec8/ScpA/Scc1 (kleisin family)
MVCKGKNGSYHFRLAEFIVTFLALLEVIHLGLVRVFQSQAGGEISLMACFDEDEE